MIRVLGPSDGEEPEAKDVDGGSLGELGHRRGERVDPLECRRSECGTDITPTPRPVHGGRP